MSISQRSIEPGSRARPAWLARALPISGGFQDLPWIIFFAISLVAQWPCALARYAVFYLAAQLLFLVAGGGGSSDANTIALIAALYPLAWSVISLVYPFGAGTIARLQFGGRAPSAREAAIYNAALQKLVDRNPGLSVPRDWFVIDSDSTNAAVIGQTVIVNCGLLTSEYLVATIAHELGHANSMDGNLTVATQRLTFLPSVYERLRESRGCLATLLALLAGFCSGEFGFRLMSPIWMAWFRGREYAADEYAARLGYGPQLAQVLQAQALGYDRPVPFAFLAQLSHPPTELRLDRLRQVASPAALHATVPEAPTDAG